MLRVCVSLTSTVDITWIFINQTLPNNRIKDLDEPWRDYLRKEREAEVSVTTKISAKDGNYISSRLTSVISEAAIFYARVKHNPLQREGQKSGKKEQEGGEKQIKCLMVGDKLISRMVRWPKGPTRRQYLVMDVMFLGKLIPSKVVHLPNHFSTTLLIPLTSKIPPEIYNQGRASPCRFSSFTFLPNVLSYVGRTTQLSISKSCTRHACHLLRYVYLAVCFTF